MRHNASLQTSFNAGKQYNRQGDGTPLGAPFHQNQPDHRGNSNTGQARYSARPDHRPEASDSSSRFGRPDLRAQGNNPARGVPFSRHSALEDVSSPDDKTSLRQVAPIGGFLQLTDGDFLHTKNGGNLQGDSLQSDEEDDVPGIMSLLGTPTGKPLYPGKVSARPSAATLPCFKYARKQCEDSHCPYSHDSIILKAFMFKRLEDMANILGWAWIHMQKDKMQQMNNESASGSAKHAGGGPPVPRYTDAPVRTAHVRAMEGFEEDVDRRMYSANNHSEEQDRILQDADFLGCLGADAESYA